MAKEGESPRRQHGLQLPLHPLQVLGWVVLAALSLGAFLVLVPALPLHTRPPVTAALSALLLLHLVVHGAAATLDPCEPDLRTRPLEIVPVLDRNKHAHVIEGGHCHLCRLDTSGPRTKHCQVCNKCVARFDHHCKWLNQCVGGRNYIAFFMCVSSAVAAAVLVAAIALADLLLYHVQPSWLTQDTPNATSSSSPPPSSEPESTNTQQHSSLPSSDAAFLAVVGGLGLLAAVTAGLLLHLCFFHIYISFLGLTTYEYIRQQRQTQPVEGNNGNSVRNSSHQNGSIGNHTQEYYSCSSFRHRPLNLGCDRNRTKTTLFSCTLLQEEKISDCMAEPTPTPPSTPQECQGCIPCQNRGNSVAPEENSTTNHHQDGIIHTPRKMKRRWNCCMSVPDSPEDPVEPRCLMNICRHKVKSKGVLPIEGRTPPRTHGHWSSAKLRMLFRVLGNLGHHRRRSQTHIQHNHQLHTQQQIALKTNQIVPLNEITDTDPVQTIHNLVPMPALPTPPRRRLISETELASALTILQQQQQIHQRSNRQRALSHHYRRRRRSIAHRTKTPALSPIRESGLSNPASPSRQNCTLPVNMTTCSPKPF